MLSSDKNVETITQLGEVLKHYLGLQKEYVKLDVIDKVVRLLTAAALAIVFFLLVIAVMLFVSLAVAHWLSAYMALPLAYLVVAVFHVLVLLLVFVKRKPWIERPLARFLADVLQADVARGKDELQSELQADSRRATTLWNSVFVKREDMTRGDYIASIVSNSVTVIDLFLLFRKLKRGYGSFLGRRKRR